MRPATEILLSAAFVLTPEENWIQGQYEQGGAMCMAKAVNEAATVLGLNNYVQMNRTRDYVYRIIRPGASCMVSYNDQPERTHAEVLAALYAAAELSEAS